MSKPDVRSLDECIADSRKACASKRRGPKEPNDYHKLFDRCVDGGIALPPLLSRARLRTVCKAASQARPLGIRPHPRDRLRLEAGWSASSLFPW